MAPRKIKIDTLPAIPHTAFNNGGNDMQKIKTDSEIIAEVPMMADIAKYLRAVARLRDQYQREGYTIRYSNPGEA